MGLLSLGESFDDPRTMGLLGMATGLLQAGAASPRPINMGEALGMGLQGAMSGYSGARQQDMKGRLLDAQLKNYDSEIEARKLKTVQDQRHQALIASMFGGGDAQGTQASESGGQGFAGVPGTPAGPQGGGQGTNLVQLAKQYGIPEQALQADMLFNGGKGIGDMLYKRGAPDMQVTNGYVYDKNRQGPGYLPQLNISNDGKATQVQIGPDGQPVISAPRGAPETFGTYQGIEAGVRSANTPLKVYNPATQREEFVPQSTVLGGQPAAPIPRRTGDPMIDAVIQTESGGNPNAVSKAGARGLMQVMPGTNASPGYGVSPARDGSESERARVGRDYLAAMQERYKDPALAAIAYNWGPGNTDMWLKSGGDFNRLPKETQSYVAQVMTRNGVNGRSAQAPQPGNFAAGPSALEKAQADAQHETLVGTAKADVQSTQGRQAGIDGALNAYRLVDQALAHPGLKTATGLSGKIDPRNYIPGTDAANFDSIAKQLQGNAFLSAFASLKGAGQITEVEGAKATAAIARLQQSQSTDEYKAALKDYQDVIGQGLKRMGIDTANANTGGATGSWGDKPSGNGTSSSWGERPKPPQPMKGMVRGGYKFKGGDPSNQANWEKQ